MHNPALLQPALALMALTFVVWVYMYVRRFGFIIAHRVGAQQVASPEQLNALLPEVVNRPSNNLKNLFELPVIFYALVAYLLALGNQESVFVRLAWAYVALRALHSAIHCTVNLVVARFTVYALSSAVLWLMLVKVALLLH